VGQYANLRTLETEEGCERLKREGGGGEALKGQGNIKGATN